MKQTVLLIGGVCGVGKSTLASGVKQLYGDGCYNFDFGTAYERQGSRISSPERVADWEEQIADNIQRGLDGGYDLVVVNSKFTQRGRRDFALGCVQDRARAVPLILRQPVLTAFHQIREGRTDQTYPVNNRNARLSLRDVCHRSVEDRQEDILLPSDKSTLPKEYLAILNRSEHNRELLSQNGTDPRVRWVAVPHRVTPHECIEIVRSGVEGAYEIRDVVEGKHVRRFAEVC